MNTPNTDTVKEMEEFIEIFSLQFNQKFGVFPHVSYNLTKDHQPYNIADVANVINDMIQEDEEITSKIKDQHPSLKTKCRDRVLVTYRQCFYKIGHDMNYGPTIMIKYTDQDHATAIHGNKVAHSLITTRDRSFTSKLKSIENELKKRLGTKPVLQDDNRSGIISGSSLHLI